MEVRGQREGHSCPQHNTCTRVLSVHSQKSRNESHWRAFHFCFCTHQSDCFKSLLPGSHKVQNSKARRSFITLGRAVLVLLENVGELLEVTFSDGEKSRAKKNRRRRALAKMFL